MSNNATPPLPAEDEDTQVEQWQTIITGTATGVMTSSLDGVIVPVTVITIAAIAAALFMRSLSQHPKTTPANQVKYGTISVKLGSLLMTASVTSVAIKIALLFV